MKKRTTQKQENVLQFPQANIFEEGIAQVNRLLQAKKDYFLDNLDKKQIKIYFTDNSGLRKVETKIWTITEKALILKESKIIPLANIIAVA